MATTDMANRIARFPDLKSLAVQQDPDIPQTALDLVYARRLLPVVGLEGGAETAVSQAAPIRGAGGMTMTYAVCPPGQGPGLHAHKETHETFVVVRGRFEFTWGDRGEHAAQLGELDVISVPPGVSRAFRNIGESEGVLQVVITGGVHDMGDIEIPPAAAAELRAASPRLVEKMAAGGVAFLGPKS